MTAVLGWAPWVAQGGSKTGRKQFFFGKKNQKTFTRLGTRRSYRSRQPTGKSFLFLFFKKEILASLAFCFVFKKGWVHATLFGFTTPPLGRLLPSLLL
jgi:hypothetical protein